MNSYRNICWIQAAIFAVSFSTVVLVFIFDNIYLRCFKSPIMFSFIFFPISILLRPHSNQKQWSDKSLRIALRVAAVYTRDKRHGLLLKKKNINYLLKKKVYFYTGCGNRAVLNSSIYLTRSAVDLNEVQSCITPRVFTTNAQWLCLQRICVSLHLFECNIWPIETIPDLILCVLYMQEYVFVFFIKCKFYICAHFYVSLLYIRISQFGVIVLFRCLM